MSSRQQLDMSEPTDSDTIELRSERQRHAPFERQLPLEWILAATAILTLFAFAVRIHRLTLDGFWVDELNTIWVSNATTDTIMNVRDHSPLVYLLARTNLQTFGESEFSGRLSSVLASLPAVSLLIVLVRQFKYPPGRNYGGVIACAVSFSFASCPGSQALRHVHDSFTRDVPAVLFWL